MRVSDAQFRNDSIFSLKSERIRNQENEDALELESEFESDILPWDRNRNQGFSI